jgi:predicted alpha/beta hydrolase
VAPADVDLERIGHHGFFRSPMQPLWEELVLPRLASA